MAREASYCWVCSSYSPVGQHVSEYNCMSGIAGIIAFDNPSLIAGIDRMVDAMKHRGPGYVHTWRDERTVLGCRLLATTPESTNDHLPLVDGGLTITADARLDNRAELIGRLGLAGGKLLADSALILEAY